MHLELWHAAVLGLIEGITEYLPVSSTGHLILASGLLGLGDTPESKRAIDAFDVVIQGGAILAVVGLYWPRVVGMARGLVGKDRAGLRLFINLTIAFIPSATLGLLLGNTIEHRLFYATPVLGAILLGGVYMLVMSLWVSGRLSTPRIAIREKTLDDVTPGQALMIGLLQCVSLWPGTSRSMMTITGGLFAGLRPKQAAEFSFLLGLPTLTSATAYRLAKDIWQSHEGGTPNMFEVLGVPACIVGMAVAAVSAAIAVRWLVGFLTRHGLSLFGWYRIVLTLLLLALVLWGGLRIEPDRKGNPDQTTKVIEPIRWESAGETP